MAIVNLALDIGYSSTKVKYSNNFYKFPTAVTFATDLGIDYGHSDVVKFKDQHYYVGDAAVGLESFTTTNFNFKKNFDPVIIFHVVNKLGLIESASRGEVKLFLTLALADWKHKDEYMQLLREIEANDKRLLFPEIAIIPQGIGAYDRYILKYGVEHPTTAVVIDIGFNTINFIVYKNGQPQRAQSKGFSGHGVSSILRPFTTFLESTFNMPFSEAEALDIFTKGKFVFQGEEQEQVRNKINEFKYQFIKKLFNSVLTGEKKILSTAEKVILAGGGCYLLENVDFPKNTILTDKPYEFANIATL